VKQQGLTLIEILVVIFIFGLGWFTLLPSLDTVGNSRQDPLQDINIMLNKAGSHAAKSYSIQEVYFSLGREVLVWNEEEQKLPASLARAVINSRQVEGTEALFRIYPAGFMDEVSMELANGYRLQSSPLEQQLRLH